MTCENCASWKAEAQRLRDAKPKLPDEISDPATIEEIIACLKKHQFTHTDWASWFEQHPDDPRIASVGDAKFHRSVEHRYSRMIAGLEAISPQ